MASSGCAESCGFEELRDELDLSRDALLLMMDVATFDGSDRFDAAEAALEIARTEIFEFQARLDEARERVADGDITHGELEALDAELEALGPPMVRITVRGFEHGSDTTHGATIQTPVSRVIQGFDI